MFGVQEHDMYGFGSIMVSSCITYDKRINLMNVQGNTASKHYVDQMLCPVVIPFRVSQRSCCSQMSEAARSHNIVLVTQISRHVTDRIPLGWSELKDLWMTSVFPEFATSSGFTRRIAKNTRRDNPGFNIQYAQNMSCLHPASMLMGHGPDIEFSLKIEFHNVISSHIIFE